MESNRKNKKKFMAFLILSCIINVNLSAFVPDDNIEIDINSMGDISYPRSVDQPHCFYQDGYVYIVGGSDITFINGTVTRRSDNMQWSDSCNSNILQISVSSDAGVYRLTFTLSDGSSYYGDYVL